MNKITHEGQEYEVLPLDRISEITHAKLAGGKVVDTGRFEQGMFTFMMNSSSGQPNLMWYFRGEVLEDLGIQPLKLLPKVPVEFVADFALVNGFWTRVTCLDDGIAYQGYEQRQFRCVEVTQ